MNQKTVEAIRMLGELDKPDLTKGSSKPATPYYYQRKTRIYADTPFAALDICKRFEQILEILSSKADCSSVDRIVTKLAKRYSKLYTVTDKFIRDNGDEELPYYVEQFLLLYFRVDYVANSINRARSATVKRFLYHQLTDLDLDQYELQEQIEIALEPNRIPVKTILR